MRETRAFPVVAVSSPSVLYEGIRSDSLERSKCRIWALYDEACVCGTCGVWSYIVTGAIPSAGRGMFGVLVQRDYGLCGVSGA
jgi:hypothetical protein